jgi:[glutamine synthetase] adenylyltransferase / [glutamine synthetase]-adenylyl-L-tyrosine phosphorylase
MGRNDRSYRRSKALRTSFAMDLSQALDFSRYASRLQRARPAVFEAVLTTIEQPFAWDTVDTAALAAAPDAAGLALALRDLRQRVMLTVLLRDLTRRADLAEVCATVTLLAEVAIDASVACHHRWLAAIHGEPTGADSGAVQRLHVVAMGKLGGRELNVSSDVDLVFVYPDRGATIGAKPLDNQDFFDRLGRRVIAALDDITEFGFVFRVDMRLRPYGESGPLTSSFAALEQYLIAQGRTWERYAWLKARTLTGDQIEELERVIVPFIFRKYLDYDAYAGLRDVHRQIREQGKRQDYARNIKLGPGGIREIEFIVQALQLVRGGHEPALRTRGTLDALEALRIRGLVRDEAAKELRDAYVFLREVEHRLQYRDDRQTQDLPRDDDSRHALAAASDCADIGAFDALMGRHRDVVLEHFGALFDEAAGGDDPLAAVWLDPSRDDAHYAALTAVGFTDPAGVVTNLARVRASPRYLQLPALSRQRFDALMPQLMRVAADASDPSAVFARLLSLLETISGRSAYLALLVEHPPILPRIAHLMGASAWAAEYLTRHPLLLDELLDGPALLTEPDWDDWRRELDAQLRMHPDDAERQLDVLRHFQHAQTFRLLAQDVNGTVTVERLADHLSALADIVLAAALTQCWAQLRGPGAAPPKFVIIGYGKLGGRELGYASDLDIVFLYDDPDESAPALYGRLAQRLNNALTAMTAAGRLYETDLRLRPDGASGLMVSSFSSFQQYQRKQAWPWEHQALSRARFVTGDAAIGARFEAERESILRLARNYTKLSADVVSMRQKMFAGHPNRTELFDIKHDPGGMVDVEFAVQYLVLAFSATWRALTQNIGNIALLARCADVGLVPRHIAAAAADAYRDYRRLQHKLRMQGAPQARVDPEPQSHRLAAVHALWSAVFGSPWPKARSRGPAQ